jgi:hypothetical protein
MHKKGTKIRMKGEKEQGWSQKEHEKGKRRKNEHKKS